MKKIKVNTVKVTTEAPLLSSPRLAARIAELRTTVQLMKKDVFIDASVVYNDVADFIDDLYATLFDVEDESTDDTLESPASQDANSLEPL